MLLSTLADEAASAPSQAAAIDIRGITADSRAVQPGFLFAALSGAKVDGATFIAQAIANGAVAILAGNNTTLADADVPIVRAADPRRALALMAARFYQVQPPVAVAVTGTNGKTSVAEFARQIFAHLGRQAASLGTIGIVKPDGSVYGSLTTPDPVTLHRTLAELANEGVTHIAFEASSHGLDQRRLDGVQLKAAAFTNLGRDHLDYHPTVEEYFKAKLRLFDTLLPADGIAVVHADDERSTEVCRVAAARGIRIFTTGRAGQDLKLASATADGFAQRLTIEHAGRVYDVRLKLIGDYQATNALLAAGLAIAAGEDAGRAIAAIESLQGVNGRLDIVGEHNGGLAVVDYAHKPEALEAALAAVRPFATGKLICVFGCGGDRDKGKRPLMGEIAARCSDVVIVTDDNPRTEVPETIRREVLAAAPGAREIGDRAEAIATAVKMMQPGDVLLVAGKGHETGQIVGGQTLPFSDHEALRAAMTLPPLWTADALIQASAGVLDGTITQTINGFSIDTRSLEHGDVFVALKDVRDGHAFVPQAFKAGGAAALVAQSYQRQPDDGALIRVDDPLRALERIGIAARARLAPTAHVIAITGSVGKTGTKEMLRQCFERAGRTHAAIKSFNNHWGVPLTLARTPAATRFAIYEIGMNHAGEIEHLVAFVRPHVAIVTTVEPVHLENFDSVAGIADAKAEIFSGLVPGGTAILNQDNPHFERLRDAAARFGARIVSFGHHPSADVRIEAADMRDDGSTINLRIGGEPVRYELGAPGAHLVMNSAAVAAVLAHVLGTGSPSFNAALPALREAGAPEGRGARTILQANGKNILLIDESYNANPASMRAAIAGLGTVPRAKYGRRIAVLGDMLELGPTGVELHRGLNAAIKSSDIDLVFASGPLMRHLFDDLEQNRRGKWAANAASLASDVIEALQPGDVIMIKGSLGSRMAPLVKSVKERFSRES
jgi:MurE/MurF fusion protein